jgi:hypothetical protein
MHPILASAPAHWWIRGDPPALCRIPVVAPQHSSTGWCLMHVAVCKFCWTTVVGITGCLQLCPAHKEVPMA